MIEFLKKAYDSFYDLPSHYLKIKNETHCHIFTILFLLLFALLICYMIKNMIDYYGLRRDNKKTKRRIEKHLIKLLGDKDKTKKNIKNIKRFKL